MANNNCCGGSLRRNSNSSYGCLSCLDRRRCWENYPYYGGPCPDANGNYDCDDVDRDDDCCDRRRRRRCGRFALFSAMLPMAVAANGIVPLAGNNCLGSVTEFPVNSGLITVDEKGTYLATYTLRVPEGETVQSDFTLNVNDASQTSAIVEAGGEGPASFTGQAIFDVADRSTIALRRSEAINITNPCAQPLVTLSLVRLE